MQLQLLGETTGTEVPFINVLFINIRYAVVISNYGIYLLCNNIDSK